MQDAAHQFLSKSVEYCRSYDKKMVCFVCTNVERAEAHAQSCLPTPVDRSRRRFSGPVSSTDRPTAPEIITLISICLVLVDGSSLHGGTADERAVVQLGISRNERRRVAARGSI